MIDSLFDCSLEEVMERQTETNPNLPVPAILRKALEALAPVACSTQGIFRYYSQRLVVSDYWSQNISRSH